MMIYSQLLKQDSLKNVYLLQGDAFLAKKCIDFFCNKLGVKKFDISEFDDENFDIDSFVTACEQMSFFAEKRLVIVRDLIKLSDKDKRAISAYIKKINPLCTLLFVDTFGSGIFDFTFAEKVELKLLPAELVLFANEEAKRYSKTFDKDAISTLIQYSNQDLTKISIEVQKLCAYVGNRDIISASDVKMLVHADEEIGVFDLTNALGEKDISKSLHILSFLLGSVEQNSRIFSLLSTQMRRMFFILSSKKSDAELAKVFQIKEFAVSRLKIQAKHFSIKKLKDILYELEDVEYMLKNAMFTQENALYYLVTYICS